MDSTVFTDATNKLLKDWIGDVIKPKVPFLVRGLVNPIIGIGLSVFNKSGDKVIPDRVDIFINGAVTELNKGNFDLAGQFVGKGLDALAEKMKGGTYKEKFFTNVGLTIMSGIEYAIEVKKAQ